MKYIPKGIDASTGVNRPQWCVVKENLKYTLNVCKYSNAGWGYGGQGPKRERDREWCLCIYLGMSQKHHVT